MLARPLAFAFVVALVAGCGAAPPPVAAEPEGAAPPSEASGGEAAKAPARTPPKDAPPDVATPAPKRGDGNVPDDYELTPRDCQELARQFGALIRSDEIAKLSPKLSDKQREQAAASIDKAAGVRREQWDASCEKSLVGLVQERKTLKCAMDAKTVAEFDVCLNGEATAKVPDEPAATPKGKKKR